MELQDDRKMTLIAEIKAAMSAYKPVEGVDITARDIMSATNVTYNIALNFLDDLADKGFLKKVKLPNRSVVYRDLDGTAADKIREYISGIK